MPEHGLPPWKPPPPRSVQSGCEKWMRRLLPLLMLPMLLSCSGVSPEPTGPKVTECQILRLTPPPEVPALPCRDENGEASACIHQQDAVNLGVWIAHVEETRRDLERCPFVQLVDVP